jgi:hypothetical protein
MNKLKCIGWVNVYKYHTGSVHATKAVAESIGSQVNDYLRTVRVYVVRGKGKKK